MAVLSKFGERLNTDERPKLGNEKCPANVRVWVSAAEIAACFTIPPTR